MNRDTELAGWAQPLPRVVLILIAILVLPFQLGWDLGHETFAFLGEYLAQIAELWELE